MPAVKQPETRLLGEWLAMTYPGGGYRTGVPVGPAIAGRDIALAPSAALRSSRPWRPEVDALVFAADRLVLVEAKILRLVDGLAKLPVYRSLISTTPELMSFRARPIDMVLLCPWTSEAIATAAQAGGVTVVIFKPPWIDEYMTQLQTYWTRDARIARADKQALLRALGFDRG